MNWLLWLVVISGAVFFVMHFSGRPSFWKATRQHPNEAWRFFQSHPAWFVDKKPSGIDVTGPFKVMNPETGQLATVWCESTSLDSSQHEFMHSVGRK